MRRSYDDDGPGSNDPVDTLWVYDGWQQSLEFVNTNTPTDAGPGDLEHVYFWATPLQDYLLADEIKDGSQTSDDVRWSYADHLGTPRIVIAHITGSTFAFNERTYDAFGNLLSETNSTYGTSIGFTGKMFDITTGFGYHINRWYDAAVGRWISEDPIVFLGGDTNLARYVANQTTILVDPLGLEWSNHNSLHYPPRSPGTIRIVVYDPNDAQGLGGAFRSIAQSMVLRDEADTYVSIGKGMAPAELFRKIRLAAGDRKISYIYFLDHGHSGGRGQQLGDGSPEYRHYLRPEHFLLIRDILARRPMIELGGCLMGSSLYRDYRQRIAVYTDGEVRAPIMCMTPQVNSSITGYTRLVPWNRNPNTPLSHYFSLNLYISGVKPYPDETGGRVGYYFVP